MNRPLPARRRAGRIPSWVLVLLAVAAAVVALFGLRAWLNRGATTAPDTSKASVITVRVTPATFQDVKGALPVTGAISARDELNIGSEANGLRIEAVYVEEGDAVRRGQVLAELNPRVLQAQLQSLRARKTQAEAAVAKAVQPNRPQDIAGLESSLRQSEALLEQEQANLLQTQANLDNARTNAERYSASLGEGFVTAQEAENRQTELQRQQALMKAAQDRVAAARFAVEQARQRLDLARAGGRQEDVAMARASVEQLAADLEQVEALLAQTRIQAPDDGVIIRRQAHLGDIAAAGKTLFTMVRQGRLELRAEVPEVDLRRIRVGQQATLESGGGKVAARVWQISPTVDPATRLGEARLDVPTSSGLRPGMFVSGTIALGVRQVLAVPPTAVLGEAGKYYVYTLEGRVAQRTPIQAGQRTTDLVEIAEGLKAGQEVVVDGGAFLNDGDTVTVQR